MCFVVLFVCFVFLWVLRGYFLWVFLFFKYATNSIWFKTNLLQTVNSSYFFSAGEKDVHSVRSNRCLNVSVLLGMHSELSSTGSLKVTKLNCGLSN